MKKTIAIVLITLVSSILVSCVCPLFGNDHYEYYGTIVKYRDGQDYSNNVLCYFGYYDQHLIKTLCNYERPIALHGGYYLFKPPQVIDLRGWAYISFTYDDLDSNRVPDDWDRDWELYFDTIQNPYEAVYELYVDNCEGRCVFPFACSKCSSTYFIDTVELNRILDKKPFPSDECYVKTIYLQKTEP